MCASAQGPVSLDLRVWATPLILNRRFMVFAARDATDEKRRAVLERLFFHDVLNAAGGLKGIIEIWPDLPADEQLGMHQAAKGLTEQLIEEIRSHRDLVAAERGDLAPSFKEIDTGKLLMRLCVLYGHHTAATGKTLASPHLSGVQRIHTDEVILSRVLGNLIKNALEASSVGQTIQVSFENSGTPVFSIHNESVMSASVQLQVFQRSFSTKQERGHGLGTYSVKLLVERYLKGTVAFTSSAAEGTTFTVTLNRA
jgi:signal transduction histidine kinase